MKNYVISLTTATERREHIVNEFSKQNISFEFFDAITPDMIDEICQKLNIDLCQNQHLSHGEKGCFLSHVCLWQKMLDDNMDYVAVFEDDVYLGENANLFLTHHDWAKNHDLVKLEVFDTKSTLGKHKISLHDQRHLQPLLMMTAGTAGYVISQKGARLLLDYIKQQKPTDLLPIDHIMFDTFLQTKTVIIQQLVPAIVIQSDRYAEVVGVNNRNALNSQLQNEREFFRENNPLTLFHTKRKLTFVQKIKRELTRPFIQLYHLFYPKSEKVEIGFR